MALSKEENEPPSGTTVGTLRLSYLRGYNGPVELSLVTIQGFHRLHCMISAYRLVRQLLELKQSCSTPWRQVVTSAGLNLTHLHPAANYGCEVVTYQLAQPKTSLVEHRRVRLRPNGIATVNLVRTFEVG